MAGCNASWITYFKVVCMPIYMDRHDVSETVTAENVAQLHQEDLNIQGHFGCRGLTYWFDDTRKIAFCLIEAPNEEAIIKMHDEAHGQVPHRVIEVDASIVESFLGRIEDPEKTQNTELNIISDSAYRTIMYVTLQQLPFAPDDAARFQTALQNYNHAVVHQLKDHQGTPVKLTNTHFLVSFRSVTHAIKAALDIQVQFKEFRKAIHNDSILLKIGVSAGMPVTEKKLIFEDTIKSAERMCKVIQGEIILSPEVKKLYNDENITPLPEEENIFCLTQTDEQFLTQLMEYTEASWSNTGLQVDDFSKPLGCSKSQLYRKITALTGKSPNIFIRDYRLDEALALLNKNTGNVSEIAFETGFSSPSYFSKCFQKRFGHQPSDYLPARIR